MVRRYDVGWSWGRGVDGVENGAGIAVEKVHL